MASDQKKVEAPKAVASSSGATTPAPAAWSQQRTNKRKQAEQRQQSSTQSLSQQSNSLASKTTPQPPPPPALKQQIKRPRQKLGLASDNKIKGTGGKPGSDKSGGGNCNKGKGPTNITNTGLNNINGCNKPQEEPAKRNIIYLTNRAKLAAQAELLAEAVPFRLPYNSYSA